MIYTGSSANHWLDRLSVNLELYKPEHNTDDALRAMRWYARSQYTTHLIQNLAQEISGEINPMNKTSQMLAVLHWVMLNLEYVRDEHEANRLFGTVGDLEMIKSPKAVLETGRYDCDCGSTLISSLFLAMGIKTRFVAVGFEPYEVTGPDGYDHVFCEGMNEYGEWVIIDPVSHPNEEKMVLDIKQVKKYDV